MNENTSNNGTQASGEESCPFNNLCYENLEDPRKCANACYEHVIESVWKHSALTDESQYELARLLSIIETTKDDEKLKRILPEIYVAVAAILSREQKLQLARSIRYRLEMHMLDGAFERNLIKLTNGNPVGIVGLGVLATFLAGTLVLFIVPHYWNMGVHMLLHLPPVTRPGDRTVNYVIPVMQASFLGGVVSILMRLKEFSLLRDFDPLFVFSTGFLKPYIGVILGIFVYAFLSARFIPIQTNANGVDPVHLWWTVGFLSGFSERFTRDIISRSSGILSSSRKGI